MTNQLQAIHLHPIKSCRRIEVQEAEIAETGLAHDRMWQVVTADGAAITQRQRRQLAVVAPELIDGGLRISASSGAGTVTIEVEHAATNDTTVKGLVGDDVNCADAGEEAAAFFSGIVGEPARLVGITPESGRTLGLFDSPITFVDAAPVLVANTASLADLNSRASSPVPMNRFRANLIVDTDEPWAEDTWQRFSIGAANLAGRLPWPRCAVPQIDQDTGDRDKEPALVLRQHRWCEEAPDQSPGIRAMLEGNALFGMSASIEPAGALVRVGDPLTVHETGAPLIAPPT